MFKSLVLTLAILGTFSIAGPFVAQAQVTKVASFELPLQSQKISNTGISEWVPSPDGKSIAAVEIKMTPYGSKIKDDRYQISLVDQNTSVRSSALMAGFPYRSFWNPDGQTFYVYQFNGAAMGSRLVAFDTALSAVREFGDNHSTAFAVSSDGKQVAVAGQDQIQFFDSASGLLVVNASAPSDIEDIAYSPNGMYLIYTANGVIYRQNLTTGEVVINDERKGGYSPITLAQFALGGKVLLVGDSEIRQYLSIDDMQLHFFTSTAGISYVLSKDESKLYFEDSDNLMELDLSATKPTVTAKSLSALPYGIGTRRLTLSGDGSRLLSVAYYDAAESVSFDFSTGKKTTPLIALKFKFQEESTMQFWNDLLLVPVDGIVEVYR